MTCHGYVPEAYKEGVSLDEAIEQFEEAVERAGRTAALDRVLARAAAMPGIVAYSDDQPRAEDGKWTDGGGGSSSAEADKWTADMAAQLGLTNTAGDLLAQIRTTAEAKGDFKTYYQAVDRDKLAAGVPEKMVADPPPPNGSIAFDMLGKPDESVIGNNAYQAREDLKNEAMSYMPEGGSMVPTEGGGWEIRDATGNVVAYSEQVERELTDAVIRDTLSLEGDPTIRANDLAAESILDAGRFGNQFETGSSGGTYNPDFREDYEAKGLGVDRAAADGDRPIYGSFAPPDDDSASFMYGRVEFTLNDNVEDRMTATFGDSLNENLVGIPVHASADELRALGTDRLLAAAGPEYRTDQVSRIMVDATGEGTPKPHWLESGETYHEFQVHGGVMLGDVKAVGIPAGADELKARAEARGLTTYEGPEPPVYPSL